MALNQLIAQGGTQNKSPVQRYMETRKQMQNEQSNKLAQQATMQNMRAQQQQMQQQQQKQKAAMGQAYAKALTPLMQVVDKNKTIEEKQAAWEQMLPQVDELRRQFQIPYSDKMETWNQQGADALISQHGVFEKAPQGRSRPDGPETVYDQWNKNTGKFEEVSRGIKSQATGSYGSFGKTGKNDIEKRLTSNLLSKDRITTGIQFVMKNQHLFDAGSKMSAGIGNAMELIGIDAPDFLKKEVQGMADLKTYSLNILNPIRKEVTGAAASYKELDKYIAPLVSVATDGKTRAIKRMQALVMFSELTTVRLNRLLKNGYQVSSKQGDKTMVIKGPDGKSMAVDKAFPLSSIPSHKARKGELLKQFAKGKSPDQFSDQDKQAMFKAAMEQMTKEGYNTDVPRKGWEM